MNKNPLLNFFLFASIYSVEISAATMTELTTKKLSGGQTELKISFDVPALIGKSKINKNPDYIVLDFPRVSSSVGFKQRALNYDSLKNIKIFEQLNQLRLILNLKRIVPYSQRINGNNLYIVLGRRSNNSSLPLSIDSSKDLKTNITTADKLSIKSAEFHGDDIKKNSQVVYNGKKLSLNFQDIEVRSVLQIIADFTGLNLVASDSVSGNITLRLQNVPWDHALDLVLKTKGLDKRKVGNVLLIAPASEIASREKEELERTRQIESLAPLHRELIQVNYAKASDLAALFQSITHADGSTNTHGSVTVDNRTNSIIVYQTREHLEELRRIVAQLDIPVRQVLIEARIVEASVDFEKSIGVRWGGSRVGDGNFIVGGSGGNVTNPSGGVAEALGNFVDLGVNASTSTLGVGFVTNNTILDLELSAMEKTGKGEVVSQPKVVTSDKETAKILKGSEIPYEEATSSGATSVTFVEAALSLEVTPQITPDNRIIMDVTVTKDEPDFANQVRGTPTITKNEVDAKVLVTNGETIVIGGVFSNIQRKGVEKVPFLGDLPVLGRLFRHDIIRNSKSELLIFLTPRIIEAKILPEER